MYFNEYEFNKAFDLHYTNPTASRILLEEYLRKYPKDYGAYPYYVSILISINEVEKAKKVFMDVQKMAALDEGFRKHGRRILYYEYGIFINKLKFLFLDGKYEELLHLYNNNRHQFLVDNPELDVKSLVFYCLCLLGRMDVNKRGVNSYLYRQMTEYHEDDFRNHIMKHLMLDNIENNCSSVFSYGFPIDLVIDEVKKRMDPSKRIMPGFFEDIYYFKYEECGRINCRITHFFKVAVFHDTCNIITMCPCEDGRDFPYIDLNYLNKKDEGKVKVLSQIDKFRKKYGNI